jgi:hypothetical protein
MEEASHVISVLKQTKKSIMDGNSIKLKELSNQTIHSASVIQDPGSLTLAVIVYTFSKLIERGDDKRIKFWNKFALRVGAQIELAIDSLESNNISEYSNYLEKIRKSLNSLSINIRPYIQEVLRKAAINKASKIYEHGISMGQTAKLLGVSQWELTEYSGQKSLDYQLNEDPVIVKKRAQMALEFFQ